MEVAILARETIDRLRRRGMEVARGHRQLEQAAHARTGSVRGPSYQKAAILETSRQVAKARSRKAPRKSAVAVSR